MLILTFRPRHHCQNWLWFLLTSSIILIDEILQTRCWTAAEWNFARKVCRLVLRRTSNQGQRNEFFLSGFRPGVHLHDELVASFVWRHQWSFNSGMLILHNFQTKMHPHSPRFSFYRRFFHVLSVRLATIEKIHGSLWSKLVVVKCLNLRKQDRCQCARNSGNL